MLSIVTNVDSLVAQQNLNVNQKFQSNTIQQLTSGYRINTSADDASGLIAANTDRNSIASLNQGVLNINNAISSLQIADGAMSNIAQMLDRMQTLATEAASTTGSENTEFQALLGEIGREVAFTGSTVAVETGSGVVSAGGAALTSAGLGLTGLVLTSTGAAQSAMTAVAAAIGILGTAQATVGAGENVLNYASQLAQSQITNNTAAESQLRDANIAAEAANLSQAQTIQQAAIAAMAQANAEPQAVLKLTQNM